MFLCIRQLWNSSEFSIWRSVTVSQFLRLQSPRFLLLLIFFSSSCRFSFQTSPTMAALITFSLVSKRKYPKRNDFLMIFSRSSLARNKSDNEAVFPSFIKKSFEFRFCCWPSDGFMGNVATCADIIVRLTIHRIEKSSSRLETCENTLWRPYFSLNKGGVHRLCRPSDAGRFCKGKNSVAFELIKDAFACNHADTDCDWIKAAYFLFFSTVYWKTLAGLDIFEMFTAHCHSVDFRCFRVAVDSDNFTNETLSWLTCGVRTATCFFFFHLSEGARIKQEQELCAKRKKIWLCGIWWQTNN